MGAMSRARETEPGAEQPRLANQPQAAPASLPPAPRPMDPTQQILWLQAGAGNQAVARMLAAGGTAPRVARTTTVIYELHAAGPGAPGASAAAPERAASGSGLEDAEFNPWSIVHDIRRAINQAEADMHDGKIERNVNVKKIIEVLTPLNPKQVDRVKRIYQEQEKTSIDNDLFAGGQSGFRAHIGADQIARLQVLLRGAGTAAGGALSKTQLEADAIELHELLAGDLDEAKRERIMALHRRSGDDISEMDRFYGERFHVHPGADLSRKLDKLNQNRVFQLRAGDFAKADALAIEEKRRKLDTLNSYKEAGIPIDDDERKKLVDGITGMLEQNRQEAMAGKTGAEAEKAVSQRIKAILSTPHAEPGRTLGDELARTLKGTSAVGVVAAMSDGSAAKLAASRLVEMEIRDTTSSDKIAELMRGLRKQGETDALASIPELPPEEKQAMLADPIAKREQLITAHAKPYVEAFIRIYDETRPKEGTRAWADILKSADSQNADMLVAMREGGGQMTDVQELRWAIKGRKVDAIKDVLRRQGTKQRVEQLKADYDTTYHEDVEKLLFGQLGADKSLEPGSLAQAAMGGVMQGRDAAFAIEYLHAPEEEALGGAKEVRWIAGAGSQEVKTVEANSGAMGEMREWGDDPDTQKMMHASVVQLKRLKKAWMSAAGDDRLQAAILAEMKKVRATVTGDATAYEEENDRMRAELRSAVSLVVQVALAVALPGAGPGIAGFLSSTAINIGASAASNMLIYGEKYDLRMLYSDVVGGGLGALGGKLGEDLAKMVAGNAAKGAAKAGADLGLATKLASEADAAKALAVQGSRGARELVEKAAVEGANIAGSTAATSAATGENGFTLENLVQNVLMNRIGDVKEAFTGGAKPGAEAPKPAAAAAADEHHVPGAADEQHVPPPGGEAAAPAARPHAEGPALPGGSTGTTTEGAPARRPSEAQRAEGHALWQKMEQVGSQWTDLNHAERRHELSNVANDLLAAHDVPPIGTSHLAPANKANVAEFDFRNWAIRISPEMLHKSPLTSADVAHITELIRHEVEHALQWWSMARLQASKGATPREIADSMNKIDPDVANLAFDSVQAKPMSAAETAAAQMFWDSVYSPTSQRDPILNQRKFYDEQVRRLEAETAKPPVDPVKQQQLEGARNIRDGLDQIYRDFPEEIPAYAAGGMAKHQAHVSHLENEIAIAERGAQIVSDDLDHLEHELRANEDVFLEQVAAGNEDPVLRAEHQELIADQRRQIDALTRNQEMLLKKRAALEEYLTTGKLPDWWGAEAAPAAGQAPDIAGSGAAPAAPGATEPSPAVGLESGPQAPGASARPSRPAAAGAGAPRKAPASKEVNAALGRIDSELYARNLTFDDLGLSSAKDQRELLLAQPDPAGAAAALEAEIRQRLADLDIEQTRAELEGRGGPTALDPTGGERAPRYSEPPPPLPDGSIDREAMARWVEENALDQPLEIGSAIRYGPLDELGRPTGIKATLRPGELVGGTGAEFTPTGFDGNQDHARGHLLANQLGGIGSDPRNIAKLYQSGANHPAMSSIEAIVRKAVQRGHVVEFEVIPVFLGDGSLPDGVRIKAEGKNIRIDETVLNRPAAPKGTPRVKMPRKIRPKLPDDDERELRARRKTGK